MGKSQNKYCAKKAPGGDCCNVIQQTDPMNLCFRVADPQKYYAEDIHQRGSIYGLDGQRCLAAGRS